MCSKDVLVDDHVNLNHRRYKVTLLFPLLLEEMSKRNEKLEETVKKT